MDKENNIFYEPDGRAFKKEFFEKQIPHHTYVYGKFRGKFHSDKLKGDYQREVFFDFKIYEGEIEILEADKNEDKFNSKKQNAIRLESSQLPDKIYFFQKKGNQNIYYDLRIQDPVFHNFKFISLLQQNDDNESFGTVEADVVAHLVKYETQKWYKKRYRKINLIVREKTTVEENISREKAFNQNPPIANGSIITRPKQTSLSSSPCFNKLICSLVLTFLGFILGWSPLVVIGFLWMMYVIYTCYFRWFRYFAYLFGLLFLMGLLFSILNINWSQKSQSYIPKPQSLNSTKPVLVKEIELIAKDGKTKDILITRSMAWQGYSGQVYTGTYTINKSDLDEARNFKNNLREASSYNSVLHNLSTHDTNRLQGLYAMFDRIKEDQNMDNKIFAEMVVSFVQQIPYYLVLEKSCNIGEYQDPSIRQILEENPRRCTPYEKFGITTPVEFMANLQGDCDSRTILLYTILKHYHYEVAIFSSEYYKHSILGINLPYNGTRIPSAGHNYTLWETTDVFYPGKIPLPISNLNYWHLSLN